MAKVRYVQTGALPLTGAGATSAKQTVVTPDDNLDRVLTGFFTNDFTALIHQQIFNGQALAADVQDVVFTLRTDFLPMHEVVKGGQPFQFVTVNDSAGAVPAARFLLFRYEVPD